MSNPKALSPYVPGVPSAADLAVEGGAVKLSVLVLPYIEKLLKTDEEARTMATCINGADAVHGAKDWDKVAFSQRVAAMMAEDDKELRPTDLPRIERILQAHLSKTGHSRAQRRAEARARRDADQG